MPFGAIAAARAGTTVFAVAVDDAFAERASKLAVEDFAPQALLYHGFVQERVDIVAGGGRRQNVEPLAGVGGAVK